MSAWDEDDWDDLDDWAESGSEPPSRGWVLAVGLVLLVPFVIGGAGVVNVLNAGLLGFVGIFGFLACVGIGYLIVSHWMERQAEAERSGPARWSDRR